MPLTLETSSWLLQSKGRETRREMVIKGKGRIVGLLPTTKKDKAGRHRAGVCVTQGGWLQEAHRRGNKGSLHFLLNFTSSLSCCFVGSTPHWPELPNVGTPRVVTLRKEISEGLVWESSIWQVPCFYSNAINICNDLAITRGQSAPNLTMGSGKETSFPVSTRKRGTW